MWGDRVTTSITLYLFGANAAAVAARDEPIWRAWIERQLLPARRDQRSYS
jgi:hypothetical protein